MIHHHLPLFLSRAAIFGRHAIDFSQSALKLTLVNLRLVAPLSFRRRATRESLPEEPGGATQRRGWSGKPPLLIHYHIFKNAGTSFEWALAQALGEGYQRYDSLSTQGFISARDLVEFSFRHPDVTAISSHQAAPPAPRIFGRDVFTSILIRDPIARIRSIYAFERGQQTTNPGALKAKEYTFKEYVEWRLETSPTLFCNYQVFYCSRAANKVTLPGPAELETAIANLDTVSIVGTVARFDAWLALAQKTLSSAFPEISLPVSHRNVTSEPRRGEAAILEDLVRDLGDTTAQYLLKNNELDMCLHQVADALLTRRLAERGVDLALLRAYSGALEETQPNAAASSGVPG